MKENIPFNSDIDNVNSFCFGFVPIFFRTKANIPFHSEIRTENSFCFGFVPIFKKQLKQMFHNEKGKTKE
jgi:hypothetical protein